MTDHEGLDEELLNAVIARHDADGPRLVLADWLEERGDPQGELIRVECEIERLDPRDPKLIDLQWRRRRLLLKHSRVWARPIRQWARKVELRRGLPYRVTLPAAVFLQAGREMLDAAPIREVKLTDAKKLTAELAGCDLLRRIDILDLRDCGLGLARLKTFLKSPHLEQLIGVDFSYNGLSRSGIEELAACVGLRRIRYLRLDACQIDGGAMEQLLDSPLGASLERLTLGSNDLQEDELLALARSPAARGLRQLDLSFNPNLSGEAVAAVMQSPNLARLTHLSFRDCYLNSQRMQGFAAAQRPDLQSLNLAESNLTEKAAGLLAPCLPGLTELSLDSSSLRNATLLQILESGGLSHLRTLDLEGNRLTAPAVQALAKWPAAAGVTSLNLLFNRIGAKGLQAICKSPAFASLNELRVNDNTDAGAQMVAKAPHLERLTLLELGHLRHGAGSGGDVLRDETRKALKKRFSAAACRFSYAF